MITLLLALLLSLPLEPTSTTATAAAPSAAFLPLSSLPLLGQRHSRLLVTVPAYERSPTSVSCLTKLLSSLTDACEEHGWEVHVVVISYLHVWDAHAADLLVGTPMRWFCLRLRMELPVALETAPLQGSIAHVHRQIFSDRVDRYDLFAYIEADMHFRPRLLRYYMHWTSFFASNRDRVTPKSSKPLIPGFLRHEVVARKQPHDASAADLQGPLGERLRQHSPAVLLHIDSPLTVVTVANITCLAPYHAFAGMYLLTRKQLRLVSSKKAWKSDQWKTYNEYNTQYGGKFLLRYFNIAIPLVALRHVLVHHGTDKYTPPEVEKTRSYWSNTRRDMRFTTDLGEVELLLSKCLGTPWDASSLPFPYPSLLEPGATAVTFALPRKGWWWSWRYAPPDATPCSECLAQGKGAALSTWFKGPSLAALPLKKHGRIDVDLECVNEVPYQLIEACVNEGCDDYHVPAVSDGGRERTHNNGTS